MVVILMSLPFFYGLGIGLGIVYTFLFVLLLLLLLIDLFFREGVRVCDVGVFMDDEEYR